MALLTAPARITFNYHSFPMVFISAPVAATRWSQAAVSLLPTLFTSSVRPGYAVAVDHLINQWCNALFLDFSFSAEPAPSGDGSDSGGGVVSRRRCCGTLPVRGVTGAVGRTPSLNCGLALSRTQRRFHRRSPVGQLFIQHLTEWWPPTRYV